MFGGILAQGVFQIMKIIVPRTCTELSPGDSERNPSQALSDYRETDAYVLLGDPGSGKTTAFETEAKELGDQAVYVTARNLIAFSPENRPEWRDKTLFVDGLDEVRAGKVDARTPFDEIRSHLDTLGKPAFRISCRPADWLGENDNCNLEAVSPNGKVTTLCLDPLSFSDVVRILDAHPSVPDSHAFVSQARERGMDDLLINPQILELLIESVADGGSWPSGLKETFESACGQIVKEHNVEHLVAKQPAPVDDSLDAAGRLCAVQLIAGFPDFALNPLLSDEDNVDPDRCGFQDLGVLRNVLETKLFVMDGEGIFKPVHRVIAEFLGARHLSKLIQNGLPARRVIALMTGEDGTVVTELRGLSAWLASVCRSSRTTLIDLDPVGVGLYGDIADFSNEEKHALLRSLARQFAKLNSYVAARAFVGLSVPSMSPQIMEVLTNSDRSDEHQLFVDFLLRVLAEKSELPELADIFFEMVSDETRASYLRRSAVEAFVKCGKDLVDTDSKLRELFDAIDSGDIDDPDNEILGELLSQTFPSQLPPNEVWNYLYAKGDSSYIGSYFAFWKQLLVERTSDDQLTELIDQLMRKFSDLRPALEMHGLLELPFELLSRGLRAHGDGMNAAELYDWLSLGSRLRNVRRSGGFRDEIRDWLTNRPDTQKAVFAEGLARCAGSDNFRVDAFYVFECLFGAALPPDFGLWCLEQSLENDGTKPRVAEFLLQQAVSKLRWKQHDAGLSEEIITKYVIQRDALRSKLDELLAPTPDPLVHEINEQEKQLREDQRHQESAWLRYVRSHAPELCNNEAPHRLLFELADIYLGGIDRQGPGPGVKGIEKSLAGDRSLVESAVQGLTGAIFRSGITDIDAALDLRRTRQILPVSFAVLAGMAELYRNEPERINQFDENQIRTAVTHFIVAGNANHLPEWYTRILRNWPETVADVRAIFAASDFKNDQGTIDSFWDLACDEEHAEIARIVSLRLLRDFPAHCSQKLIESLENLLLAAMQHADKVSFEKMIQAKCSSETMNDAQKARWFGAGLIASPESFIVQAEDFVRNSQGRTLDLAALFQKRIPVDLGINVLSLIVRLVGGQIGPEHLKRDGWATPEMKASELVYGHIQRLANSPDERATEAMEALVADPTLAEWNKVLSRTRENQKVIRRDASYRHPTVEQVRATLDGAKPSNAGDLAALLVDRFDEIALRIRTDNTDIWRQYWNEGSRGKPERPKIEDHCRDALLSDLRYCIPDGLDAQPEGQYAHDNRADIRVASASAFHVPIEIKKNGHPDLWSAIHHQLIAKYVSDPNAGGYGIFLVFWFGKEHTTKAPDGSRPEDSCELKKQLQLTMSIEQARKISICVIDVSPNRSPACEDEEIRLDQA